MSFVHNIWLTDHKMQSQTHRQIQFKILFTIHENSFTKKIHPVNSSANNLQEKLENLNIIRKSLNLTKHKFKIYNTWIINSLRCHSEIHLQNSKPFGRFVKVIL